MFIEGKLLNLILLLFLCRLYWVHRFIQVLPVVFLLKIAELTYWIHI